MKDTICPTMNQELIDIENKFGAHNYHPLPVVLAEGNGVFVKDVEGKVYMDFLSGYSAVNQGHCHPKIVNTLIEQAQKLTLTSRAFHNEQLAHFSKFITDFFKYEKMLPMNTGVEGVETAIKIARKWGYNAKQIPENEAKIIICNQNFHGRTVNVISFSSDDESKVGFGPFNPGYISVDYNNIKQMETAIQNTNVCAVLIEPIQGEAGVIVPDEGYLAKVKAMCEAQNVLFIADEIQTGLGRTGKMLACDYENVRPDILILGKALSGGVLPVSVVLADDYIMKYITPGTHGSTYGGNPLACAVATVSLTVLVEEQMIENAFEMGEIFRHEISSWNVPIIQEVRGRGLLNAIEINHSNPNLAWDICMDLMHQGLLAKPTHGNKIRFSPPLVINRENLAISLEKIYGVLTKFN